MKKKLCALFLALLTSLLCLTPLSAAKVIKVSSIKLSKTALALYVGDTSTLKVTFNPTNASNKTVVWSSSNSKIATVSKGKVTAKSQGNCKITATSSNGKKATCQVTAESNSSDDSSTVDVTSINFAKSSFSISVGDVADLGVSIIPSDATDQSLTWALSDSSVVTIKDGSITGLKAGTCVITAVTTNGITATCSVTVTDDSFSSGATSPSVGSPTNTGIFYGDVSGVAVPITADEFQKYLDAKYLSVNTPMGIMYPEFSFIKSFSGSDFDFELITNFTNESTLFIDDISTNKRGYSDEEIAETKSELQELQKGIYEDFITCFPHQKISSTCTENDSEGFNKYFLIWQNYNSDGYITALTWDPDLDDIKF